MIGDYHTILLLWFVQNAQIRCSAGIVVTLFINGVNLLYKCKVDGISVCPHTAASKHADWSFLDNSCRLLMATIFSGKDHPVC